MWKHLGIGMVVGALSGGSVCLAAEPAGKTPSTSSPAEVEPEPAEYEPPPAEVEPPPAPLKEDSAQKNAEAERARLARKQAVYGGLGWTGVGITLGLAVSGTTLGVLSQRRSDELSLLTTQTDRGVPKVYDADLRANYERLQQEGRDYRSAMIGCLIGAGVFAVGAGSLFYGQNRAETEEKKLSFVPLLTSQSVGLALGGRF